MTASCTPAYWAKVHVALDWLTAEGWKIGTKRTTRGRSNIPTPGSNKYTTPGLYDLHDVVCEMDLGPSAVVARIRKWSGDPDCAGPST